MPERHHGSSEQRYLYNGMEQDLELSGNGNSYTTEFRQYDPRLMRWKSLDPLMSMFPWMSPYVAFDNNPVYYTDPLGLSSKPGVKARNSKNPVEAAKKFKKKHESASDVKLYEDGSASINYIKNGTSITRYYKQQKSRKTNPANIKDPSYGYGRENRTQTYAEKAAELREYVSDFNKLSSSEKHAKSGAGYVGAYSMDVYDLAAAQTGVDELTNAQKDALDAEIAIELLFLLAPIPIKVPGAAKITEKVVSSFAYITPKIAKQLARRNWTRQMIQEVINEPYTIRASTNKATGNAATVFYREDGHHVIVDNFTNEVIQISNRNVNASDWIPDEGIIDPFIPRQ